MKYLITYDIRNNKRWNRVFRLLKKKGLNVQLSCFEVDLSKSEMDSLIDEILDIIEISEDKVYFFPISATVEGLTVKFGKDEELNRSEVI